MIPINYEKKAIRGKLTPTILGYIAGIIDGEGSIFIGKVKNKDSGTWQYYLNVCCAISQREPMDMLARLFNDHSHICQYRPPGKETYKPSYQWGVTARQALTFLRTIYPYLWIKRKQAILGIEFQELKMREAQEKRGKKLDESVIQKREEYYWKMKELNGVITAATTKQEDAQKERCDSLNLAEIPRGESEAILPPQIMRS